MKKPNLLWIMTDQQRADSLGCMGDPAAQTPHLDGLAQSGILFTRAFCQSPVCMASRAVAFTGRYPGTIPVRGMGLLPPDAVTTPEVLQRQGYATGAFGKVHFTPEQYTLRVLKSEVPILDYRRFADQAQVPLIPDDPCKRQYGFQEHVGCEDCLRGAHRAWLRKVNPGLLHAAKQPVDGGPSDLFMSPYPDGYHESAFIARQAIGFIERQSGERPWFAFCSFIAPHHPFEAPRERIARFDPAQFEVPAAAPEEERRLLPERVAQAWHEMDRWTESGKRAVMRHYAASISLIDDGVGQLLHTLRERGELDNTLIVFAADHGEFACRRGLVRKPSLHYDDILRVPLIIRLPGGSGAGRRVEGLVELADLHPTLLGLVGIAPNPGVQGRDWSEALRTGGPIGRESIYADMYDDPVDETRCLHVSGGPYMAVQTLRTERWKLNLYPTAGFRFGQLFDLEQDPGEQVNRYGDPAVRSVREELLWNLNRRRFEQADPVPRILSQW